MKIKTSGVRFRKIKDLEKPYESRIAINRKMITLGSFATYDEAHAEYKRAKKQFNETGVLTRPHVQNRKRTVMTPYLMHKIENMVNDGICPQNVAERLGVGVSTVYRVSNRRYMPSNDE